MNDKTFKTVKTVATLIPAALILFIAYLNTTSPFYFQKVESQLENFVSTMPASYEEEGQYSEVHGSLTNSACSLMQYEAANCQGANFKFFIKTDVGPKPLNECREMFTWVNANDAKYFLYNDQAIELKGSEALAQMICINLGSLQTAGMLKGGYWENNFNLGQMQVSEFPGDPAYNVIQPEELNQGTDVNIPDMFNAITALGNYTFTHNLHRNLTKAELTKALNAKKLPGYDRWYPILGEDNKVVYLEAKTKDNTFLCVAATPFDEEFFGVKNDGKTYYMNMTADLVRLGDVRFDRCVLD